ncbi:MAG: T9SS type A sorting domain-containing protein [Chlorobi bacterium]|nr:T9SS type A sorting domain-containing protein [Chlorobiota bacterium]
MKKLFTSIVIMLMATVASFAQVTVTFNLDMRGTDFNPAAKDLYVSGEAGGIDWATPGSDPNLELTDPDNDTIFTVVLSGIDSGYYYMDYYETSEGAAEWGPEWPTPLGHDRMLYVDGSHDVVINDKWGEILTITLNVDMTQVSSFDSASQDVYMAGNIYPMGWETAGTNPDFKLEDPDQDGIYTIEFDSISGADFFYKYYLVSATDTTPEWTEDVQGWRLLNVSADNTDINDVYGQVATGIMNAVFNDVQIYPNPSSGRFTLLADQDYTSKVMNINGQIIQNQLIFKGKNTINLTRLPAGIYFIRLHSGNNTKIFKVVVR